MITITYNYKKGKTQVCDTHPIANDKDYCEVVTTNAEIQFTYCGCKNGIIGETKEETEQSLIQKMIDTVSFDLWFEENWNKKFTDFGLEAPTVFDHEEDESYSINSIDNFINNCQSEDCYDEIKQKLTEIAKKEIKLNIKKGSE